MIVHVCAFTTTGRQLIDRLQTALPEYLFVARTAEQTLQQWAEDAFKKHLPLLFIGAAGIAVRTIAPFVQDKTTDSPVLVMDETGVYVIPLLSGHLGGANELARTIAAVTGAQAVITTATDVQHCFAVDVFAQKNALSIVNRDGIQQVSSLLVNGSGPVTLWAEPSITVDSRQMPPELSLLDGTVQPGFAHIMITSQPLSADSLHSSCCINLVPKMLCAGIGCKKGKAFEELLDFLTDTLQRQGLPVEEIASVHSIDLKKKEVGLMTLAQYLHVPFTVFTAEELAAVPGTFSESAFVEQTTGVSNVCERSAMAGAGKDATLVLAKTARDGMALALAQREDLTVRFRCYM